MVSIRQKVRLPALNLHETVSSAPAFSPSVSPYSPRELPDHGPSAGLPRLHWTDPLRIAASFSGGSFALLSGTELLLSMLGLARVERVALRQADGGRGWDGCSEGQWCMQRLLRGCRVTRVLRWTCTTDSIKELYVSVPFSTVNELQSALLFLGTTKI